METPVGVQGTTGQKQKQQQEEGIQENRLGDAAIKTQWGPSSPPQQADLTLPLVVTVTWKATTETMVLCFLH